MTKEELTQRIAEDVGMCYHPHKNEMSILCDLLYYTTLHTKWHKDAIVAIKGLYPEYFNGRDINNIK